VVVKPESDDDGIDPVEFIKALLKISPEDAADVRKIAAEKTKGKKTTDDGQTSN
jgi:hypothetical protein